jgi:hypothetical protein
MRPGPMVACYQNGIMDDATSLWIDTRYTVQAQAMQQPQQQQQQQQQGGGGGGGGSTIYNPSSPYRLALALALALAWCDCIQ